MKKAVAFLLSMSLAVPCNADSLMHGDYFITIPDVFVRQESEDGASGESSFYTYDFMADNGEMVIVAFYDYDSLVSPLFPDGMGLYQYTFQNADYMTLETKKTMTLSCGDTADVCLYTDTEKDQVVADASFNNGETTVDLLYLPASSQEYAEEYLGMLSDVKHVDEQLGDFAKIIGETGK